MELCRLENILLIDRACEEDKKPEQFISNSRTLLRFAWPKSRIKDTCSVFLVTMGVVQVPVTQMLKNKCV
jgi:hypothetical protein